MYEIDEGEEINYDSPQDSECSISTVKLILAEAASDDDNEDYEIDC
jgi:hypothetical protein